QLAWLAILAIIILTIHRTPGNISLCREDLSSFGSSRSRTPWRTCMTLWETFYYCENFGARFTASECARIIALHRDIGALRSTMPGVRDSDLFWVPRTTET